HLPGGAQVHQSVAVQFVGVAGIVEAAPDILGRDRGGDVSRPGVAELCVGRFLGATRQQVAEVDVSAGVVLRLPVGVVGGDAQLPAETGLQPYFNAIGLGLLNIDVVAAGLQQALCGGDAIAGEEIHHVGGIALEVGGGQHE